MNLEELQRSRAVYLFENVSKKSAERVIKELLYIDSINHEKNIGLYINSDGGELHSFLAIYDVIHHIKSKVMTLCIGRACSAAALLLLSGSDGLRYALPNSTIMLHGLWSGTYGNLLDMQNLANQSEILQKKLDSIILKHTKLTRQDIDRINSTDVYYSAKEAKKYKIIDEIR
jgi:ATP-dependent Clp protease, protease subunit